MEYQFHPNADIFPLIEGQDFLLLVKDIQKNGLLFPIYLYENQIVDGRNRYRACKEAGIEPKFEEWSGHGSLTDFVMSANFTRRHLNESQRAMAAADALPFYEAEAKLRQIEAGQQYGEGHPREGSADVREAVGKASEHAAAVAKVSPRMVESAKRIKRERPDLVPAILAGKVRLSTAERKLRKQEEVEEVQEVEAQDERPAKELLRNAANSLKAWLARYGGKVPGSDLYALLSDMQNVLEKQRKAA